MGFLGFGKRSTTLLVEVMHEGPGRLRLNGNRVQDRRTRERAISHDRTVCWLEFSDEGLPSDQGLGPASTKLGPGEADQLLRELRTNAACKRVVDDLKAGSEQTSRWLQLAGSARGN